MSNPTTEFERVLADEVVERFIRKCARLWPGCRVVDVRIRNSNPEENSDE